MTADAQKTTEILEAKKAESGEMFSGQELPYQTGMEYSEYLIFPVTSNVTGKDVSITNDYMAKVLTLTIQGMDGAYLYENGLSGNLTGITSVQCNQGESDTIVKVMTDGVYEPEMHYNGNKVYLKLVKPEAQYDKIVVIDPGHGADASGSVVDGIKEKDLVLAITTRVKRLLDETDIKVYYTRLEDEDPDLEKRVALANDVNADLFISLHLAANVEDSTVYGIRTFYNSTFFIPEFGSADLAYLLEEKVCNQTREEMFGISPGEEDIYLIRNATVPVTLLEMGYLTNRQELILLQKEDYQQKIAQGIVDGIVASFEQMNGTKEEME